MPGIRINSLQDLLLLRELKNQANPTYSAMNALAQGISQGIAEEQEKKKKNKEYQENLQRALNLPETFGGAGENTQAGKLYKHTSINPITGETNVVYKSQSPETAVQKATRIKTEAETQQAGAFQDAVKSGVDSITIARNFPSMAKEIADLEELGVIGPPQVQNNFSQEALNQIGVVDDGGRVVKTPFQSAVQDNIVTERTAQGRPKTVISRSGKLEEGKIKSIQKIQETQLEESVKSIRSYNRIKSSAQGLVAAGKRIVKEQGGFGLKQIITGKVKRGIAKSGLAGDVKPEDAQAGYAEYRGQVKETVLALSPILTNQNRIIQGVVDMLSETLWDPNQASTSTEFTAQLRQTTKNAYRLSKALNTGALTAEEISDLNAASPEEIKRQFKKILNKSSWTKQDEKDFVEEWNEIVSTPATTPEDLFQQGGSIANKYGL